MQGSVAAAKYEQHWTASAAAAQWKAATVVLFGRAVLHPIDRSDRSSGNTGSCLKLTPSHKSTGRAHVQRCLRSLQASVQGANVSSRFDMMCSGCWLCCSAAHMMHALLASILFILFISQWTCFNACSACHKPFVATLGAIHPVPLCLVLLCPYGVILYITLSPRRMCAKASW